LQKLLEKSLFGSGLLYPIIIFHLKTIYLFLYLPTQRD